MVNIGVLYAITAGVAAITIFVIQNRVVTTEHKELVDKKLVVLLRFFNIFCIVDMIWGILSSGLYNVSQFVYSVFTYAFHLGAALSAFLWAGYVIRYLKVSEKSSVILNTCRGVVLTVQLTVLVSNIWTKSFFYVDAEAKYHSYELRNFMFVMQFLYYITLIVSSIIILCLPKNREDRYKRKRYRSTLVFSCVPLAFGFGQMLWPDASMYSLGFMLTAVLIYSINISSERERYIRTIYLSENSKLQDVVLGLASDYQVIYLVNLNTNDYEVFGESGEYRDKISTHFDRTQNFFADLLSNIERVIAPEDSEEVKLQLSKEYITQELSDKRTYSFNYRLIVNGEYRYYLCKIIRLTKDSENDRIIIGIFDDDARMRKETEQRKILEDALSAAESASRAKTAFLFNMSHDIRTPMNSIIGFTNLARRHLDDEKYLSECLDKVSMSGEHLLSLINDVLDMSRIESGKLMISAKPESVSERNEQIVSIVKELALTKSINFVSELINIEKEWILCDALHVKQIVLNILSNAIKYTNPGGRVSYTVEQVSLNDECVTMKFTVEDTGIGMSKEFIGKIYDEFERENNDTGGVQGTGLGMSIVKRLVDMMDGKIDIESSLGVGTKVSVTLDFPVAEPVVTEQEEAAIVELPAGRRVLLVDDNILNREIATEVLDDLGVACEEAGDGAEAVEKVMEHEPGYYDLVLMDVQMPKMDGYEATKNIRGLGNAQKANIPIIAMTANAFDEDKQDAYNAGMNAHLSKPIDISSLSQTLKKYL